MINAFPKIFQIGQPWIKEIFNNKVEITEKIDGSQFSFGKINGELFIRSKGQQLFPNNPEKMFSIGIDYVVSIQDRLPDNFVLYCEFLNKPKHNTLKYDRVPKNSLICFGAILESEFVKNYGYYADCLDIEVVPSFAYCYIKSADELKEFLERESILGGTKVEGVVVKNYEKPFLLGGQPIPLMMGKYVSEAFKERHGSWRKENTSKGKWEDYKESFKTEARWSKAIQHLRDNGELQQAPQDIGNLIKEIHRDIQEEEKENIKDYLWNEFGKDLLRKSTAGFPEWYKDQLLNRSFDETSS